MHFTIQETISMQICKEQFKTSSIYHLQNRDLLYLLQQTNFIIKASSTAYLGLKTSSEQDTHIYIYIYGAIYIRIIYITHSSKKAVRTTTQQEHFFCSLKTLHARIFPVL